MSICFSAYGQTELSKPQVQQQTSIQRVLSLIAQSQGYKAGRMLNSLLVYDKTDILLGRIDTVMQLDVSKRNPEWSQVSQNRTGSPGMVIAMDFGIQGDPATVLKEYDSWLLNHEEAEDGKQLEVWVGSSHKEPGNSVSVWLEKNNQYPRKMSFKLPYKSILGSSIVTMELKYIRDKSGVYLPSRAVVDQTGRFLLTKRRIHFEVEYQDWKLTEANSP
jgi:hypothetical protein